MDLDVKKKKESTKYCICVYMGVSVCVCVCVSMCVCVCVWVCVCGILCRFQQSFRHIRLLVVRRDSAGFLSAANTDAPCHRHQADVHRHCTLLWHRAYQSLIHPLNVGRLARKQKVHFGAFGMARPRNRNRIYLTARRRPWPLDHHNGKRNKSMKN